ncbi:hypothetical protein [Helicobacter sp. 11S03491-1]|uniref:hypothetical protein n=1 Tax=Helicobacter sp. 11S03491-1 TaxID=1476196 RepID=UPI000BA51A7C|nr:hypothetical protein [Helicobacter sp. 11S03491-1]PAF43366.1 hypothetical protein BKH45_01625 [Helicobacter sp. 11S03491-1]
MKKNLFKIFLKKEEGVATLEFAFLFLPFFLLIMMLLESLVLIYQLSMIDYITTSAGKYASATEPKLGYKEKFQEYIQQHKNSLLLFTDVKNSLKPTLIFCRSLEELQDNNCTGSELENQLIVYTLEYKIRPIFKILRVIPNTENTTSKVVYYSEHTQYRPTPKNEKNKQNEKTKTDIQ